MRTIILLVSSALAVFADLTVTVPATSPTQAILVYSPSAASACEVEVSESNTYSPLVNDVDLGLFPGSNQDSRPGAFSSSGVRVFVVGTRKIDTAANGTRHSRALQQNKLHYYRVTCGTDVATGTFTTKILPYGATYQDLIPTNPDGTYNYPSTLDVRNSTLIDPQTGVLMNRVVVDSDHDDSGGYNWPNPSAGGFGQFCADDLDPFGNYRCGLPSFSTEALYLYTINPTTGAAGFLGFAQGSYNSLDSRASGFFGMGTAELTAWGQGAADTLYQGIIIYGRSTIARWVYTGNDTPPTRPVGVAPGITTDMLGGSDLTALARGFNSHMGDFDLVGTVRTTVSKGVYTVTWASGSQFIEGTGMVNRQIIINGIYYVITSVPTNTSLTATTNDPSSPGPNASPVAFRMPLFNCALGGVQANYGIFYCNSFQQDSPAWIGAWNFGNGLPYGKGGSTAGMAALAQQYALPATRWTGNHTYEFLGETIPITSFATSSGIHGDHFGNGPYEIVLGTNLGAETPGTIDTNVSISSVSLVGSNDAPNCTDVWTIPAGWVNGQPLSPCYPHYLMDLQVGDVFVALNGEDMEITAIHGPTLIDIRRGTQQNGGLTPTQSAGDVMKMTISGYREQYNAVQAFGWGYGFWDFVNSPNGTEHAGDYVLNWGSHPVTRGTHRSGYSFDPNAAPTKKSEWGVPPPFVIPTNSVFAGVGAVGTGNTYQKHPGIASGNDGSQFDVWYFVGANAFGLQANTTAILVPGTTHIYRYDPTGGLSWNAGYMWSRNAPIFAKTNGRALVDVSAPGKILTDADDFVWCWPAVDGECVAGSHVSDPYIYFSLSTLSTNYCMGGENPTSAHDICIGNWTAMALSVNQSKFVTPSDTTGSQSIRPLVRMFQNYEGAATFSNNVKSTYAGDWGLVWRCTGTTQCATGSQVWAVKIPPDPAPDGINRGDFIPAYVSLTAPQDLGGTSARIKFWYAEQGGTISAPYCTSRREGCVATRNTIIKSAPFSYESTDSYSPMPCAVSCSIAIPVYPLHAAYFTAEFLNASGQVFAATPGIAMENVVVLGVPGRGSPAGDLATQIVSFTPPGQVVLSQSPFALTATASSGLPVSFTSTTNDVCTVSGSTVTAIAVGICSITATQLGNAIYGPATAVSGSISIISAPSGGGNTLSVSAPAITIVASPAGGPSKQSVTISLQTYTLGAPTYSIATTTNQGVGWLSAAPVTGTMTQTFSKGPPYTYTAAIDISADATAKEAGVSYQGNVTFSAGGATTSTLVTMNVPLQLAGGSGFSHGHAARRTGSETANPRTENGATLKKGYASQQARE